MHAGSAQTQALGNFSDLFSTIYLKRYHKNILMHTQYPEPPLCIDLDGTLIKTDLLIESCLAFKAESVGYLYHSRLAAPRQVPPKARDRPARRAGCDSLTLPTRLSSLSARGAGTGSPVNVGYRLAYEVCSPSG